MHVAIGQSSLDVGILTILTNVCVHVPTGLNHIQ